MRPLTYYIDKCIIGVYVAALAGGVLSCTVVDTNAAASGNRRSVNIRCVASTSDKLDYMTADDFLQGSEKAANHEDITRYLENLKRNGLFEEAADVENGFEEHPEEGEEPAIEEKTDDADAVEDSANGEDKAEEEPKIKIDPTDWKLILVNKQNPVPDDFDVKLAGINGSLYADERIINDIYKMMDAASDDGVDLMICSAYRSYERQRTLFNNKIDKLMDSGMTYLEAYRVGSMNVTVPGTSEHHLGLALDILTGNYTTMDDGFGDTEAGKWLAANAPDYGFILRYPEGKEEITGIVYEPWHFRYVGKEYARDITERGLTLEEYLKDCD
ncbi:MAG: M15 family metallopeptidase [Lachnospiraceae bacterium]|nr:M15 family metallopeptidase [Lachnospiraceae bacterium]